LFHKSCHPAAEEARQDRTNFRHDADLLRLSLAGNLAEYQLETHTGHVSRHVSPIHFLLLVCYSAVFPYLQSDNISLGHVAFVCAAG
jgi:hypothetical protein